MQQIQQTAQQAVRDAIAQERQNASAEALAVQGRLPNDTAEVFPDGTGLPAALEKAEIGAGGRITLHFNAPKSGLKGRVVLTPDVDEKYLMIRQWDCTTPDFAFIADAAPTAATSGGKHSKANPNRAKRPSEKSQIRFWLRRSRAFRRPVSYPAMPNPRQGVLPRDASVLCRTTHPRVSQIQTACVACAAHPACTAEAV